MPSARGDQLRLPCKTCSSLATSSYRGLATSGHSQRGRRGGTFVYGWDPFWLEDPLDGRLRRCYVYNVNLPGFEESEGPARAVDREEAAHASFRSDI